MIAIFKRIILVTLLIVLLPAWLYPQSKSGIYYNNDKLPSSRVTGRKVSNLFGAYITWGLSAAKRDMIIEGKTSDLIIKDKKPVFTVIFKKGSTDTVFSDPDFLDFLVLVKLKEAKRNRKMQTGSYGLTGVESTLSEKYVIALKIEEIDEGVYKVSPREELNKGEYAFWFSCNLPTGEIGKDGKPYVKPYNIVYDFSVKP